MFRSGTLWKGNNATFQPRGDVHVNVNTRNAVVVVVNTTPAYV